jgi:hypothetical protein
MSEEDLEDEEDPIAEADFEEWLARHRVNSYEELKDVLGEKDAAKYKRDLFEPEVPQ